MPIPELPGYEQGWFTVQDESAMRVAAALAPDRAARSSTCVPRPGGKTTHLAELMGNQGQIVACDVDERLRQCAELPAAGDRDHRDAGSTRGGKKPRPDRSTRCWSMCRAATPACWAGVPRCAGGCSRRTSPTWCSCRRSCCSAASGSGRRHDRLLDVQHRAGGEPPGRERGLSRAEGLALEAEEEQVPGRPRTAVTGRLTAGRRSAIACDTRPKTEGHSLAGP